MKKVMLAMICLVAVCLSANAQDKGGKDKGGKDTHTEKSCKDPCKDHGGTVHSEKSSTGSMRQCHDGTTITKSK